MLNGSSAIFLNSTQVQTLGRNVAHADYVEIVSYVIFRNVFTGAICFTTCFKGCHARHMYSNLLLPVVQSLSTCFRDSYACHALYSNLVYAESSHMFQRPSH